MAESPVTMVVIEVVSFATLNLCEGISFKIRREYFWKYACWLFCQEVDEKIDVVAVC